jgi:hypothetical protein
MFNTLSPYYLHTGRSEEVSDWKWETASLFQSTYTPPYCYNDNRLKCEE